jgi:starch phosphorylase
VYKHQKFTCFDPQIIFEINLLFIEDIKKKVGSDFDRLARLSIVEEGSTKVSLFLDHFQRICFIYFDEFMFYMIQMIRMENLALVASHTVNGVSQMHSACIKSVLLKVN